MQVKMKKTITHNNMLFSKGSIYSKDLFNAGVFERLEKAGVFSPVNSTGAAKKEAPKNDHANIKGTDNNLQEKAAPVDEKKEEKPTDNENLTVEKEDLKEEKKPSKSKKGKK